MMRAFLRRRRAALQKERIMALQTLRKGASGLIAKFFLVILTLSFVIWGIADVFRGFGRSTVARVGGTEISADAFRSAYLEQLQQIGQRMGRGLSPDQARAFGIDRQVLNQLVTEATLDEQAARLGLAVSDAQVADAIRSNPAFRRPGSTSFDPAYFQQLLRANNLTEPRFVALERKRMLRAQVLQSYAADVRAPTVLLDAIHRYEGETRSVSYLLVTPQNVGPAPTPTDEDLRSFFEAHKAQFRAPEYRKISVLALTPEALAAKITVGEEDLRADYERRPDRFGTAEKREIQQIVFPNATDATAAAEKIKAGASFADIVTERGLSAKDTDLGLVAKADVVDPRIAAAAFALAAGATSSAPVDGRFGATLVHVVRVEAGSQQPFEAVKDQLRQELALDKAHRELLDQHDAIEDERAAGSTLAETAKKLGLTLQSVDAVDRSGQDPQGKVVDIPDAREVIAGAFDADPGVETDTLQLPKNGGFVWYETNAIIASRDRTFEEARAQVAARWTEEALAKAVEEKAKALLAKAEAGEGLPALAASSGLTEQQAPGLLRGRSQAPFAPDGLQKIFDTKVGGLGIANATPIPARAVFLVTDISPPTANPDDGATADQVSQQMENDLLQDYLGHLRQQIGVSVNNAVLAQSVGTGAPN